MIITVTLNAALDKTLEVPSFTPGRQAPQPSTSRRCRAARASTSRGRSKPLGQPVIATGLAGGATGTRIVEALNDESILNAFVRIREESRTNTAVLDPTTGVHTEINERGPSVTEHELELFEQKLLYLAAGPASACSPAACRAGSSPDIYAKLIRSVRKLGVLTVVDTDGEPLKLAVRAEPDVVSPNELEAEELAGHEFAGDRRSRRGRRRDHAAGPG